MKSKKAREGGGQERFLAEPREGSSWRSRELKWESTMEGSGEVGALDLQKEKGHPFISDEFPQGIHHPKPQD